jgi:hypothetical protein
VNSRSSRGWGKCASRKKYLAKDLCPRNALLEEHRARMPQSRKTGTSIVGLVFQVLDITQILFFFPLFPLGDPDTVTAQIVSEAKAKTK